MAAVTASDVSELVERDSMFWNIGGAFRSATRHLALFALVPVLFIAVLALAQVFASRIQKVLDFLNPRLPKVTDKSELALIRDLLTLTMCSGAFYRRYCLSRSEMDNVLSEVDETIDSINFALNNWEEMQSLVREGMKRRSPELPLSFAKQA